MAQLKDVPDTPSFDDIDLNSPTECNHVERTGRDQDANDNGSLPPKQLIAKDSRMSWLICAAAFSIQVFDVGIMHIFGVFFVVFLKEFGSTKAEAAWVGSACYGLAMACGPLSGTLMHRFGNAAVAMTGALICSVALLLSSFVESLNMLYLTFSLMYGFGCSLAFTPTMVIAGIYFEKYVSLALGIMTAGSSFGTLVLAPISQTVIDSLGWRNCFRILAGLNLLTMISGYMFKPSIEKVATNNETEDLLKPTWWKRNKHHFSICKSPLFGMWVFAICCVQFGYYIPYVHLIARAEELGLTAKDGATLMMCLGSATCGARIVFGKLSDARWFKHLFIFQGCIAVQGISMILLPFFKTLPALIGYVFLIGLMDGCYVVCMPVLTFKLMGMGRAVLAWGFMIGASSVTFTLGPPCAGWIYDATKSYDLSFHIAGIPVLVGAAVLFTIPWLSRRYGARENEPQTLAEQTNRNPPDIELVGFNIFSRPLSMVTLDHLVHTPTSQTPVNSLAKLAAKKIHNQIPAIDELTKSKSDMRQKHVVPEDGAYTDFSRSYKSADVHFPTAMTSLDPRSVKDSSCEMPRTEDLPTTSGGTLFPPRRSLRRSPVMGTEVSSFTSRSNSPIRTPVILVMNTLLPEMLLPSPKESRAHINNSGSHSQQLNSPFPAKSRASNIAVDKSLKMEDVVAKLDRHIAGNESE